MTTGIEPTLTKHVPAAASAAIEAGVSHSLARAARRRSRVGRYLAGRAWLHATLLCFVALFLFPFVYMFATSMKTDEELIDGSYFPTVPTFQPVSPRVLPQSPPLKPADVAQDQWDAAIRDLTAVTRNTVNKVRSPTGGDLVNFLDYRTAATNLLLVRLLPRLGEASWNGPTDALVKEYAAFLTPQAVEDALTNRLARLELRGLQVRSLDAHIYPITLGPEIATKWTIESGDATLLASKDSSVLRYHFASPDAQPITLRCDFPFPTTPDNLHKLIFALKPDDSWHRIDATFDLAGTRWVSQKPRYLGTHRRMSILFQPPTFDDHSDRKKIWVPLRAEGLVPEAEDPSARLATLRLTISPSSTPRAIWGKAQRNYTRAFESVPFWRYVRNSLTVVALTTVGTLLSAGFVAYAFARLHWPGRSIAFGILLATMMLPEQVTFVPQFMIWRTAGLYNTLAPLWLPAWFGIAFFIFLMTQHMKTIPRELEEAARIDGCSPLRTWWQVIMPQCKPALAAIAILSSMSAWNNFLSPLIYLRDQSKFPLSLGLYALRLDTPEGGTDWTLVMAGNVLMTLPVIVIFFLFQRYFIEGMTMSAVKA
jgi:ABC-type glycerol-3-phosphate transport system permease component